MLNIQKDVSLKPYTTFGVEVKAAYLVEITHEQDILDLISTEIFTTHPHLILWWGANILFTKDYPGLIIKISLKGKTILREQGFSVIVNVWAGENRHETMMRSIEKKFAGGENMVLIPWLVWSAPVGNIGAYGKEAKDIIEEVEGIDLSTGEKKIRTNKQCEFAYRDSIFKHALKDKIIITSVSFLFKKYSQTYIPTIDYKDIQDRIAVLGRRPELLSPKDIAEIIISIRESKLPDWTKIGTAGSFFKNPVVSKAQFDPIVSTYPQVKGNEVPEGIKLSAGQLIELAGYKGKSEWPVATYEQHALVIINTWGATGAQVWAFAQAIQKKVNEMFGVVLEAEVIIL